MANTTSGNCDVSFAEGFKGLSDAQNQFTKDLLMTISRASAESTANIFFSPLSICVALAMTHLGTRGKTEEQLRTALHLPSDVQSIKDGYRNILSHIQTPREEYELRTSNRAYVSHILNVLQDYSEALVKDFRAELHSANFNEHEKERLTINKRVEEDTNQRIKNLIPAGVLSPLTRLVLVNAVFFKGLWLHQFEEKSTTHKPFWTSESDSVQTPMMSIKKKKFRSDYLQDIGARRLAMDYKGGKLSFVIVLPDKKDGLKDVEHKLDHKLHFTDVDAREREIVVEIPKFKMEESLNLKEILKSLGVTELFDDGKCDLSGISTDREGLSVSEVIHKAFLEVNEEGSEAAAATAVIMMARCMPMREEPFVADHPFLFYILDKTSGMVLFLGKLVTPNT